MTVIDWIIIGIIAAIILGYLIIKAIKFYRMTPEEKKEMVKAWLVGAVVAAEAAFTTSGAGQEKMQMVMNNFKKHAPILCKIIVYTTKTKTLEDFIKEALTTVKDNFEKK